MTVDKSRLDVSGIFLVYITTVGDIGKTAAAFDLDPGLVQALATQEGWLEKVKRISMLSKSEKPGDWERAQNRALNFVQSYRLRQLIDKMLLTFDGMTPAEVMEKFTTNDKNGQVHLSARFFGDLSAAAEKAHSLSYQALGDTVGEREERGEGSAPLSTAALHVALIAALSTPCMQGREAELLVQEASQVVLRESKQLPETDRNDGFA